MSVETEPAAIVFDRADPHRSLFGERVTPGLPLETQGIEHIPHFRKSSRRVKTIRSTTPLPAHPSTAVLPTCSTLNPGDLTRSGQPPVWRPRKTEDHDRGRWQAVLVGSDHH